MNWIQENKKLAGILGLTFVGAAGLGVFLFLSYSDYTARMEEYDQVGSKVNALSSQKLYPSAANSAEKEKLVSDYADKVNLLRTALLNPTVQQVPKPMTETEFQSKLKERAGLVRRAAEATSIVLPSDFALGFDEYTVTVPRSADVAAELGVHLDVVEKLVAALIESGVTSLDSLDRTKLDTERAAPPAPKAAATPTAAAKNKKKPLITAAAAAEPVLDRYPIKLIFTADQAPFQAVMSLLSDPAKMPHFLVVRQLKVENTKLEGPLKEEVRSKRQQAMSSAAQPGGDPALAIAPKVSDSGTETILPPPPAPPDTFTIMGEEQLKVYLEVDYIRFRKPAKEDGSESVTAAKP